MFELTTEAALLATFRYGDRKRVELSRDVTLPVVVDDYRAGVDLEPAIRTLLQRMARFADTLDFDRARS